MHINRIQDGELEDSRKAWTQGEKCEDGQKKKSAGTLKSRAAKMRRWSVVLEQCQDWKGK